MTRIIIQSIDEAIGNSLSKKKVDIIQRSWTEAFYNGIDVINNTPKADTKLTPLQMHFPERREITNFQVIDEAHKDILENRRSGKTRDQVYEEVYEKHKKGAVKTLQRLQAKKVLKYSRNTSLRLGKKF
jgi:hypothetical protein